MGKGGVRGIKWSVSLDDSLNYAVWLIYGYLDRHADLSNRNKTTSSNDRVNHIHGYSDTKKKQKNKGWVLKMSTESQHPNDDPHA